MSGSMSVPNIDEPTKLEFASPTFDRTGEAGPLHVGTEPFPCTLDEPVIETITRDLKGISKKLIHVLTFKRDSRFLNDWDLWGPLLLFMIIAG